MRLTLVYQIVIFKFTVALANFDQIVIILKCAWFTLIDQIAILEGIFGDFD